MMVKTIFTPNERVSPRVMLIVSVAWVWLFFTLWQVGKPAVFPSPVEVLTAVPRLWADGLGQDLWSSLVVSLEALILSIVVSLPLAYVSRTPGFAPLTKGVSKLRFLSPGIFFIVLLYLLHDGHAIKVVMLALGEAFFLTTTMLTVVSNIPEARFDDARTLKMSEWLSVWYVVIRGTLTDAFDAVRDNQAMGWAMLFMVEGIVRSEGGIGVLMFNQEKHFNYADFFAIALHVVAVGIALDYLIGLSKKAACPYA